MSTMSFKELIVIFSLIFANYAEALKLNDECQLLDGTGTGRCTLADDCEPARSAALQNKPRELGKCGSDQSMEIVCCPITTPKGVLRRTEIECNEILKNSVPAPNPVVGGELASPGEFPYVVALGYEDKNGFHFYCGGSIISKDYVLTEGNCMDSPYGRPTVVRSGLIDVSDTKWNNETDVGIADYIFHPNYTKSETYNDVGLLRLSKPLRLSSNVRAVCLETNHDDPKGTLIVTGWKPPSDWTKPNEGQVLKQKNVTAISLSECSKAIGEARKLKRGIVPEMLCAVYPAAERRTCRGEAGGPLLELTDKGQHRLIGVSSLGKGCELGIYMRVSRYLDWIESIVWPNSLPN